MVTIKIRSIHLLIVLMALTALFTLWGIREGRSRERIADARRESVEARTQYAELMDSLQRERTSDSLRLIHLQRENEMILRNINSIRKANEKKRLEIMYLTTDSLLYRFDYFRARLDSLLSGKYIN